MTAVTQRPLQHDREAIRGVWLWEIMPSLKTEGFKPSPLIFLLGFSFILRLPLLIWPEAIYNDSAVYIRAAKGILEGKWSETIVPPLYPALMAATKFVTGDLELAGILVSLIFGSLLCIPVFCLGREMYGVRVGTVAALLSTVQPYLFKYSGSALTESLYYFVVASTTFLALKAHSTGKPLWTVLFGFMTAMGYLTRPEAIGFLVVFAVSVVLFRPTVLPRSLIRRVMIVVLAVLSFVVFSSPYLVLLRNELGRWEISKKAYLSVTAEETGTTDTVSSGKTRRPKQVSISSLAEDPLPFIRKAAIGTFQSFYKFQQSLNPLLFLLAVWGFARRWEGRYPWKQNVLLLSFILFFFAFVFGYFKTSARYSSHMIPIVLPWAAYGFTGIAERLPVLRRPRWLSGKGVSAALLIVMAGLLLQGIVQRDRDHRLLQKEVGLWMKQNLPKNEKLVSRTVQEPFYAEMEFVRYNEGDFVDMVDKARSRSAKYVVIDDTMERSVPDILRKAEGHGLKLLRAWNRGRDRVWLFEFTESAGSSAEMGVESSR